MPLATRTTRTIVIVAVLLAAVWIVSERVQKVELERQAGEELVVVYRASGFIAEGTEGLTVVSDGGANRDTIPLKFLPEGAIQSLGELEAILATRVAAEPIRPDSILTRDQWRRAEEP